MRKHLLLFMAAVFTTCMAFAQNTKVVTGKLLDSQTKEALIGATVSVKGTTNATTVALDGSFKIKVPADGATLTFSFIGYIPKSVQVTGASVGTITLDQSANAMKEVVITGDVAVDRKTPVAVTTLNAATIEEKIGSQDLPLLLQEVPGVMATNTSGFGDTRVSIRGFKSTSRNGNVAMTINGIPVNDMENGNTYWSDFTGLSDVTTSFQVQRGLGAAKIIVPSFGGTINITTRNTDAVKGGYVFEGIGSDGYNKMGALVSTGLTEKGWAITFQGSKTQGNYHADNTEYTNYNYFFNVSKVLSPSQTLSFSFMGADQHHNTRFSSYVKVIRDAPMGIRYNPDAGILNGEPYDPFQNYFAKPLASLNHSWIINDKSSLSTVLYGTYGLGGGVSISSGSQLPRVGGGNSSTTIDANGNATNGAPNGLYDYTPIDLTAVVKANSASVDGSTTNFLKSSVNNHHWFGLRSTYNTQLTNDINLSAGVDLRDYEGVHYTQVYNLLGAQYANGGSAKGSSDLNNPNAKLRTGDKMSFYNVDDILSGGGYAQAEYSKNNLTAFVTASGSESSYQRNDYFNYLNGDPNQHSPWKSFFTYQAKGGANYNINDQMNVFANVGYITKPPYFDAVFVNFTNSVNNNTVTEKLFSYELGYGFKTSNFKANLNFYRSLYMNRAFTQTALVNNITYLTNLTGVNEMHEGGELELYFKPVREITLNGSLSVGNWYYTKDSGPAVAYDDDHNIVSQRASVPLKGRKIGDAAQTQARLGASFDLLKDFRFGGDYFYFGNYTSDFNFNAVTTTSPTPWKVPNYGFINLYATFKFKIAGLDASLVGNVYNLLDIRYITDSFDGRSTTVPPSGTAATSTVYYGYGRNFATSLRIKF